MRLLLAIALLGLLAYGHGEPLSDKEFDSALQQNAHDLQALASNAGDSLRFKQTALQICGCACCPCAMSCNEKLSRQDRALLLDQNNEQLKKLHPTARMHLQFLLSKLDEEDIYVKLMNPVPQGHAIRYKNVQGDDSRVMALAKGMGLKAFEHQIETPLHGEYVGGTAKYKAEVQQEGAPQNFRKNIYIPLTMEQKRDIDLNNEQELNKLDDSAAWKVNKFVNKLEASNTYIKLYSAIPRGHTVDYQLVSGSTATMEKISKKMQGIRVGHASISVDAGGQHVVAEAEEGDIHYADTVNPIQNTPV